MCHFHKYKNLQVITKCHNLYYKMHSYYRMLWNIPLSAVSQNIIALVCFLVHWQERTGKGQELQ